MWLIFLIPMLWQVGFQSSTEGFRSSERNPSNVSWVEEGAKNSTGAIKITGTPQDVGRSSAWAHFEDVGPISLDAKLTFYVKGNEKPLRVRVIFHPQQGSSYYYHIWQNIETSKSWQKVTIPLNLSRPLWSSNYPYTLTPGVKPDLFLFFENLKQGEFEVYVDEIKIEGGSK